MNGQCIKQDFLFLKDNPNITTPVDTLPKTNECCYELSVLAELVITSELNNDKMSFIRFYDKNAFSSAVLKLQKYVGGIWSDIATLNNDNYGTFFAFGFHQTIYNENAIGYLLDFQKVLTLNGEGDYRIQSSANNLFGNPIVDYSLEYCLKKYTVFRADTTVRLKWFRSGNNGASRDFKKREDFGNLNFENQIRVNGSFGYPKISAERENVKYQNGKQEWISDSITNEYTLILDPLPEYVHQVLKYDFIQADSKIITDYNIINPVKTIELDVISTGGYDPDYMLETLLSPVELTFGQAYDNFNHKRS